MWKTAPRCRHRDDTGSPLLTCHYLLRGVKSQELSKKPPPVCGKRSEPSSGSPSRRLHKPPRRGYVVLVGSLRPRTPPARQPDRRLGGGIRPADNDDYHWGARFFGDGDSDSLPDRGRTRIGVKRPCRPTRPSPAPLAASASGKRSRVQGVARNARSLRFLPVRLAPTAPQPRERHPLHGRLVRRGRPPLPPAHAPRADGQPPHAAGLPHRPPRLRRLPGPHRASPSTRSGALTPSATSPNWPTPLCPGPSAAGSRASARSTATPGASSSSPRTPSTPSTSRPSTG